MATTNPMTVEVRASLIPPVTPALALPPISPSLREAKEVIGCGQNPLIVYGPSQLSDTPVG